MTICTCVYNYLCQKVVLARIGVFVYWCSDAPSLTPGHLPRVTVRTELSSQSRAAAVRWAEEFGQELKRTSRGVTDSWSTCAGLPLRRWCLCSRGGHPPQNRSGHPEEIRLCSRVHLELLIFAAPLTPVQISRKRPQLGKRCLLITDKTKKKVRASFGSVMTQGPILVVELILYPRDFFK